MKTFLKFLVIPFLLVFMSTCTDDEQQGTLLPDAKPIALKASLKPLIEQDNTFAFDLFKKICETSEASNVLVSPLSVSMALSMTMNGAKGNTRAEMEKVLQVLGFTADEINEYCKTLREALLNVDPSTQLEISNSIWCRSGFPVDNYFIMLNRNYFNAEVKEADFTDSNTLKQINDWCAKNMKNKIPKIIDQISSSSIMYLINAVYFKGIWRSQFDKKQTATKIFHSEGNISRNVSMMSQNDDFNYYTDERAGYLELPYGNNAFSMVLILPHENKELRDIISQLDNELWNEAISGLESADVNLQLPRFKSECKYNLDESILPQLGMHLPFLPEKADFTGISQGGGIYISKVIHKTFVEVTEEGAEAAAATAVEVELTSIVDPVSLPKVDYIVNKPFLFAIREKSSGVILFMGKMGDI